MALVARLKSLPAQVIYSTSGHGIRALFAAGSVTASLCLAAAILPAQAAAVVREVGGVSAGVQLRSAPAKLSESTPAAKPSEFANPSGNPVLHGTTTFAIYWDPKDEYHGDWQQLIDGFLSNLASDSGSLESVFAVDEQYTDRSDQPAYYRSSFHGAYTDTDGYPTAGCSDPHAEASSITCLTDTQLREELQSFIAVHGLPKGMGVVYYLLTPPGVTVCLDGGGASGHCSDYQGSETEESYKNSFCSYHAAISPTNPTQGDGNTILYGMIPWTAGGEGDYALAQTPAYACQDGGFDPSSKPVAEEKETSPDEQEPNQLGNTIGPDGYYDHGLADLIINQIGVEQQNIVTDPLLDAWQDPAHNESTDECRNKFFPTLGGSVIANEFTKAGTLFNQTLDGGDYYINDAFSLAALRLPYPGPGVACPAHVNLAPQFTATSPVDAGEVVGFDGMESDIDLDAAVSYSQSGSPQPNYATYVWNFGDGSPGVSGYAPGAPACSTPWLSPCAASVFHAYTYGGTYDVTLTVTDVGGNVASVTHPVTVVGPPPPTPGVTAAPAGAAGSPPAGSGAVAAKPAPTPTLAAAVSSHSLRNVLRHGLVVRYLISERATGHFEVLVPASLARRLHLSGPRATELPAGTPPQTVIGKAYLVTTAGGHNSVTIQLSKANAARLAHVSSLTVMLHMVVRNAFSHAVSLLTSVTLSH